MSTASNRVMTFSLTWVCLLMLCGTASAQTRTSDPSGKYLADLLARMHANISANGKRAQQYTSDELWHNLNFDKNGKTTEDVTAKYENVFVEGLPYRRKVEQNGKPLTGKAAEDEEKRYKKAVEERKGMSLADKRRGLHFTFHFSLPVCCLATLFENRIVKHETIDGRDTIIVESVPRAGAKPANQNEKSALDWKETTWIDAEEAMPARFVAESLSDHGHFSKGMVIQMAFVRLIDAPSSGGRAEQAIWLLHDSTSNFRFKLLWIGGAGTSEQVWSNFKKFHVDMRLLDDSLEALPAS